jgi:glyoxylase-like metal-dependent hydrolase (beta-lactamase superfamily II)/rhodanese-related sulfurtransferase
MNRYFVMKQFTAGSCYSYVLNSDGEAVIIDPHISLTQEYKEYLKKKSLRLKFIIDTHTHADHFSLAAVLKKEYKVPVLMGERAISEVAEGRLKEADELAFGLMCFKIIYTPGHTDDAISIFGEGRLFTGDVLLIGSVGRTDFQNGSPESMFDTLQKLKNLPDKTQVFPGHDYHGKLSSSIGSEKQNNPFLKENNKEVFVKNMREKNLAKPFNMDNIIRVNRKGEAVGLEMVSAHQAQEIISKDSNTKLLDVRSAFEYSQIHIKDSVNIPIDMLNARIHDLSQSKNSYIVLCRTGNRSPMAADMLLQAGIHSVKVLQGGMTAWQKAKLAVIKGEGGVSLERQVRFAAGSLVLLGIILSWFVHPVFLGLSIFVSCGLIFSGLTDSCLMGMLLMKLPYNKKLYKSKTGGGTCAISG